MRESVQARFIDSLHWKILPPEPHERMQCVCKKSYLCHEGTRTPEIDWNGVRHLYQLVAPIIEQSADDWYMEELALHFEDAFDERLSEGRRMIHGDIVFSRMWQTFGPEATIKGYAPLSGNFVAVALDAGLR